jgi:hypothetical protein
MMRASFAVWADLATPERLRRWMAAARCTEWTPHGIARTIVT